MISIFLYQKVQESPFKKEVDNLIKVEIIENIDNP